MKIVRKNEAKGFRNSAVCTAFEYEMGDKDINGAVVEIKGRFPDSGRIMNEVCKEMGFVIKGSGKVVINDREIQISENDLVLVEPGEKYYWEGNLVLFVASNPAWYPEQNKKIE